VLLSAFDIVGDNETAEIFRDRYGVVLKDNGSNSTKVPKPSQDFLDIEFMRVQGNLTAINFLSDM
jgi:hypothetical protein